MARVTGPLFSMSASGSIGKALTYGTWKGREWVREWFKPENPKKPKQVNVRTALTLLIAHYQGLSPDSKTLWDNYATPFNMAGVNKFVSRGMNAYVSQLTVDVLPVSVTHEGTVPAETWVWTGPGP